MEIRISRYTESKNYTDEHAGIFFELLFMMRGDDWYEDNQQKILNRQLGQCDERFLKIAFPFFGVDPLFDWVPILEKRFAAIESSEHAAAWKAKSKEAYGKRYTADIRNHLFELSVLGYFAEQKILKDTDCRLPGSTSQTNIDALVSINSKNIYVEATYTSQQLFDAPTHTGQVMYLPVNEMFEQAIYKVSKKALMGKQLHLVHSTPAVLILGRNPWGACELTAREGLKDFMAAFGLDKKQRKIGRSMLEAALSEIGSV